MDASVEPVTCPMVEKFRVEGHDSMDRGWSPMGKGTNANEVKKGYDLESVRSLAKDERGGIRSGQLMACPEQLTGDGPTH